MHLIKHPSVSPHGLRHPRNIFGHEMALIMNDSTRHLSDTFLCAPTHVPISNLCAESLQSMVMVLSRVESEGEVGANPVAAAAASASGINPVSRDHCCFFFSPSTYSSVQGPYSSQKSSLPPTTDKKLLKKA